MDEGCLPAEVVDALLAGHLDGEAARRAHAHVDTCGDCRVLVGQLAKDALGKDETLASNETLATGETALENTRPREHRVMAMPARIDRYSIVKRLGAGGMGIVYLADDDELKRKVVIKLLRTETLEGSAADRARLLREAQAMAKVSHPNVVPIYDVGVYEERVFLAMEYIDGQDLSGWLAEPRAPRDVLAIFVAAGRGLAAAHRAGLVHRDFKPHNVMLAKTGEVKVTDFGLARAEVMEDAARSLRLDRTKPRVRAGAASLLDSPLTLTGALIGTPAYMAPEQILVEPIDGRTDQFSFCVALYEALYRERPFTGNTVDELFEQTLEKRPVFKAIRGVSARVRAAMKRGLSVEPDDRFPTMEALLAEIEPRAKKPYLVAGVLATVALGAAGVAIAMQRTGRAVCTGGEAELASVWSADRESALEAAFVRADAKFGPTAFRAVKPALERYAKAWIANHGDACNDTVREEQSEAAMDRRMACLRKRRYELDATLEVLGGKPDPSLLVNAAAIVDQLASPDVCANTSALAPEVTDPKLRAAVDEIQKGLAKTSALAAAARIDEASAIMKDVAARAEQLGQSVLLADVYFSL
ncbi:MAG TPA: serine/threonine-protein kinase, partial [Kofleriaceae bacterium]|nr:serine/threonine-protein kinase [Kofleriaceae bacterium]